jgi:hypothetical protein
VDRRPRDPFGLLGVLEYAFLALALALALRSEVRESSALSAAW